MKYLSILLFALFALNANAQYKYEFQYETPDTSSASQTHYIYPSGTSGATETGFMRNGSLAIAIAADSLSGATAGTVTLEFACDEAASFWVPYATTLTANGPNQCSLYYDDNDFSFYKWRVKIVNTSATQSNKLRVAWAFKAKA